MTLCNGGGPHFAGMEAPPTPRTTRKPFGRKRTHRPQKAPASRFQLSAFRFQLSALGCPIFPGSGIRSATVVFGRFAAVPLGTDRAVIALRSPILLFDFLLINSLSLFAVPRNEWHSHTKERSANYLLQRSRSVRRHRATLHIASAGKRFPVGITHL